MAASPKGKPATIDDYLAPLPDDQRAALERLRKIVRAAVPKAEECISYGLPAFRLDGKIVFWFGAAAKHCAIYGPVGITQEEFYAFESSSKGTLRFQPEKPPPAALVRKMVKARIAQNAAKKKPAAKRVPRSR